MITDINQLDLDKRYTYADYLTWEFDEMVELIKGKIFPNWLSPRTRHQWVSRELTVRIGNFLKGKKHEVFCAYFDVRLCFLPEKKAEKKIDTVVQPDICVICDLSKLDSRGCNGAPDWTIEILSKGTAKKDLSEKFEIYQNAGVKEYWIIHPYEETVIAYILNKKGKYESIRVNPFTVGEKVPVGIFPDFEIELEGIFPNLDL